MNCLKILIMAWMVGFGVPPVAAAQPTDSTSTADIELDLRLTYLESGTRAPFSGVLMTSDSLNKIRFDHILELRLLENDSELIRRTLELELEMAQDQAASQILSLTQRLENRDNYITRLEDTALDRRPSWVLPVAILGGFIIGASTAVAITYAVNQ